MTRSKPTKRSLSAVRCNKPKRLIGLGQQARSQVGCLRITRRERSTAGVESEPNSSTGIVVEHGKAARSPGLRRADLTARRVMGRSIGKTEEAKASGNALDRPTSVWSEMAREQAEPHTNRRKANDDRLPSVDASRSCGHHGARRRAAACPYCQVARSSDSGSLHHQRSGLMRA